MNLPEMSISLCFIVVIFYYGFFNKECCEWVEIEKTKKEMSMPPKGIRFASFIYLLNLLFVLVVMFKFDKYLLYPVILATIISFEYAKDKKSSVQFLAIIASIIGWLICIIP